MGPSIGDKKWGKDVIYKNLDMRILGDTRILKSTYIYVSFKNNMVHDAYKFKKLRNAFKIKFLN